MAAVLSRASPRGRTSPRVALGPLYYEPCVPVVNITEGSARVARQVATPRWASQAPMGLVGSALYRSSEACVGSLNRLAP